MTIKMKTRLPEIVNPLKHAGTNRFERLATEMEWSYVQIEERHEKDFLVYAEKLAHAFQYFDQNNQPFGTWESFFNSNVPENRPHKALFIAFLRLLEALNEHANGLTKRHLDFYYKDVLTFVEREGKPAQIHLFFECAQTLKERFIAKGEKVLAGETKDGKQILYELIDELVINHAKIEQIKAVFKHNDAAENRLFEKDYSTLLSVDPADNKNGFPAFGEQQLAYVKEAANFQSKIKQELTMNPATVGFAIASPLLRLAEGERTITLKLKIENGSNLAFNPELFQFSYTAEKNWATLEWNAKSSVTISADELVFTLNIPNTAVGLINYNSEIHNGAYQSNYPVLRLTLKSDKEQDQYAYKNWKNITLKEATLKAAAKGVRSLLVQNEQSVLDPSKPFRPFGAIPAVGDHFYVGHTAIFSNELTTAKLHLKWKGVPHENWNTYYANYTDAPTNSTFKVETAVLEDKEWKKQTTAHLFNTTSAKHSVSIDLNPNGLLRKTDEQEITQWNYATHYGFARLKLLAHHPTSRFQAFGHLAYPKEVMRINQLNVTANPKLELNQPYTPFIEQLTLDFETKEETITISNTIDSFYHVSAYGQQKITLGDELNEASILPSYAYEGECYIGLSGVNAPQSVSLLFQLAEGTANAEQSQIKSGIKWHYLSGNEWKEMNRLRISKDTTRNLLNTGIIRFDLPKDMDASHQVMPDGLYWLKASIPQKSAGIDRVLNIHTQAVAVKEIDPALSNEVVAPNTVAKLANGSRGITEISQPYASFDGTNADSETLFYARMTERLRHKNRAVMIWDYERLVLDEFPNLYKVKCLNHTNYQTEMVAGHVMVAVIPNLRKKGERSPFQPKLSIHRRMEIYDFLRERISPFIYLRVENPIYEPIRLSFNVGFHQGHDEGYYGKKLHRELQEFLSPWAFENELTEKSDLVFGGELHKSTVLKFIEDLPYVDFVNDFNMYHIYRDPSVAKRFNSNQLSSGNNYEWAQKEGPCYRVKLMLDVEDPILPTALLDLKVRFLGGVADLEPNERIQEKFINELKNSIARRTKKGEVITKTLLRILAKNMYYVDKIVTLDFYKVLPEDYIMEDVDVAIAKTSRSIMVTSEQHRIGVYRAGDYNCEGNVMIGIGFMIVEADFIIPPQNEINYEYKAR